MNKLKLVLVSLLSLTSIISHAGGDLINNGGGIAEKNILYAYFNLDKFMLICLRSEVCKLNDDQKMLLQKISDSFPQERESGTQIQMQSEKKSPGAFMIDGSIRVAKTGSAIGSPIVINVDQLYTLNESGQYDAVTIPEAVAILIHELGHHQGSYSHETLDLLGVKVSLVVQKKFASTPMLPWSQEVSAEVFNPPMNTAFPLLLLNIGDEVVDISELYRQTVRCHYISLPVPIFDVPDLPLLSNTPLGSILSNLHWAKMTEGESSLRVKIQGNISNKCSYRSNIQIRNNSYQMALSFKIRKLHDKWKYDPSSLEMKQYNDGWWKIIRLDP